MHVYDTLNIFITFDSMWIIYLSSVSYGAFAKILLRRHENGVVFERIFFTMFLLTLSCFFWFSVALRSILFHVCITLILISFTILFVTCYVWVKRSLFHYKYQKKDLLITYENVKIFCFVGKKAKNTIMRISWTLDK